MPHVTKKKLKLLVIVGPTASGKSGLAVRLARKWGGEIISADSRQVYKGLNIGTGKITKKEMRGIPHYMLNIINPRQTYTAGQFRKDAEKIVQYIAQKGKLPIVVGGTGFYIDALLGTVSLPEVSPNPALRKKLEENKAITLFKKLKKLDPARAKTIDPHNKRRLIRAIEIATALGKVPKNKIMTSPYEVLKIGIDTPDTQLKKNITIRLLARLESPRQSRAQSRKGMIAEVQQLHKKGLSWKRMDELGLEYRFLARYLKTRGPTLDREEMIKQLNNAIWHYAKRQKRWFKRDGAIYWYKLTEFKNIEKVVAQFLHQNSP